MVRTPRLCSLSSALVLPASALAGGLLPTARLPVDPAPVAAVRVRHEAAEPNAWGRGARFAGDLDGDGLADVAIPAGDALELVFGDASLAAGDPVVSPQTRVTLPVGCAQSGVVHWSGGDVDGDGKDDLLVACPGLQGTVGGAVAQGAVLIVRGRGAWPGTVVGEDVRVLGEPADALALPPLGARFGLRVAVVGDLDRDGADDFVVTSQPSTFDDVPVAWVFHGGALADLHDAADATWRVAGDDGHRCLGTFEAAPLGDLDGDLRADFALFCGAEPTVGSGQNDEPIAMSAWLGSALLSAPEGALALTSRQLTWGLSQQRRPQPNPFAALGDLDGQTGGEVGLVDWFEGQGAGAMVLRGGPGPWSTIEPMTPSPGPLFQSPYDDPAGVQLAAAGNVRGLGGELWLRWGVDEDAVIELLPTLDIAAWADTDTPPAITRFTPSGGAVVTQEWRFGLGGAADADGDGLRDLLVVSGVSGAGCAPDRCAEVLLVSCGDADGDGASACAGDCDDLDPARGVTLREVCDAVDHDCDGLPGTADADGDGAAPCAGDCDDLDPAVGPGRSEACDAAADVDCDGLLPQDDEDGDGTVNCEDCQPWDAAFAPGAAEVCDGLDNDCDGALPVAEQDIDQDGHRSCDLEADCDDLNPFIRPGRFEDCRNGVDDDCDGSVDGEADADGDDVTTCQGDCDDGDAAVYPGAAEQCDGLDNDCDGEVDDGRDQDGDGWSVCQGDCDDGDAEVHPTATGVCDGARDGNCDGASDLTDPDGDGWTVCGGDCDESRPDVAPALPEWCDRVDNDCDGVLDQPFDGDADGWATCGGDCRDDGALIHPAVEEPDCADGVDGDCDGSIDGLDTDCPVEEPTPEEVVRPYGVSCADCGGGGAGAALLLIAPLGLLRRGRRRAARGAVVGLSLLAALPASAARKEPGAVIYLSPLPDVGSMQEATRLSAGVEAVEVIHGSEVLEDVGDTLQIEGAQDVRRCPLDASGKPAPGPSLPEASAATLDALIELDHARARDVADAALGALACLPAPPPRRVIAELAYLRGIAELELGRAGDAERSFAEAVARQPDFPGDPNFSPDWNAVLDQVRARSAAVPAARFTVPLVQGAQLRVDGERVDAAALPMAWAPGPHLVQISRGRDLWTADVTVAGGESVAALLARDRVELLRNPRGPARAWAKDVLGRLALDADVDLIVLVDLEQEVEPIRYLYRASADRFSFEEGFGDVDPRMTRTTTSRGGRGGSSGAERSSAGDLGRADADRRTPRAGGTSRGSGGPGGLGEDRFRLRAGAGFLWAHPFPYVQIPVEATFRLVQGLAIDLQVEAANPGKVAGGPVWLPTAALGLSYRVGQGPAQPRFGVLGRVGIDASDGSLGAQGGVTGRVGLDLVPPLAGPLFFWLDVQAGIFGRVFWGTGGGGLGLRF